uniref:CFA20 domain-containing protein n=1 Tax=Bombyx mori TaxID=7091 RepID=A0A8R2M398_BOMMO|nr:cilia- and flagella-associated protein 20 [Bombyx mori]
MFKNTYQNGLLSIFYSCGSNPLALWDMEVKNGHIKRLTDNEVNSVVLEIVSTNVATTFIRCPRNDQVLDDKNMRRRFRISNFQSTTKIKPFCTTMPIGLSGGWNQIQFNLSDFTRRAYGTQFLETLRVQIHANARLRRIYFSERLYTEEELPQDYKLYLPLERKQKKEKPEKKEKEVTSKVPKLRTEVPIENKVEAIQEEVPSKHSTAGTVTPAVTEVGDEQPTDAQLTDETNIVVADDNPQEAEDVLETEPPVAEE